MFKKTLLATACAATFVTTFASPVYAVASDDKELNEIRAQMKQMKDSYEARMQALEKRLEQT